MVVSVLVFPRIRSSWAIAAAGVPLVVLLIVLIRIPRTGRDDRRASCAEAFQEALNQDTSVEDALRNRDAVVVSLDEYERAKASLAERGCYATQDNSAFGCPDAPRIALSNEALKTYTSLEDAFRNREAVFVATNEYQQVKAFSPYSDCYLWDNSADGCLDALATLFAEDKAIESALSAPVGLLVDTSDEYKEAEAF